MEGLVSLHFSMLPPTCLGVCLEGLCDLSHIHHDPKGSTVAYYIAGADKGLVWWSKEWKASLKGEVCLAYQKEGWWAIWLLSIIISDGKKTGPCKLKENAGSRENGCKLPTNKFRLAVRRFGTNRGWGSETAFQ